ncbi:MAG: hypothetical protein AB7R90_19540 [Reyranellaceae bacterium]
MTFARALPAWRRRGLWPAALLCLSLSTSCADVLTVDHPVVAPLQIPEHLRRCPDRPAIPPPDLEGGRYSDLLASGVIVAQAEWMEICEARLRALDELLREFDTRGR